MDETAIAALTHVKALASPAGDGQLVGGGNAAPMLRSGGSAAQTFPTTDQLSGPRRVETQGQRQLAARVRVRLIATSRDPGISGAHEVDDAYAVLAAPDFHARDF